MVGGLPAVSLLNVSERAPFRRFTHPAHRRLMVDGRTVVTYGAYAGDQPVGLALSRRKHESPTAQLLSVVLAEPWRGLGLGQRLVEATAAHWQGGGEVRALRAVYTSALRSFEATRALLRRAGFGPAEKRMHMLTCTYEGLCRTHWYGRYSLPPSFELFPWDLVTEPDRRSVEEVEDPALCAGLSPFDETFGIRQRHPSSLGIRHNGRLVGWVLTEDDGGGLFQVGNAYILPAYQARARILPAYTEATERMRSYGMERVMWGVTYRFPRHVRFMERWVAPYAEESAIEYEQTLVLKRPAATRREAQC